jgi:hypothetical protein
MEIGKITKESFMPEAQKFALDLYNKKIENAWWYWTLENKEKEKVHDVTQILRGRRTFKLLNVLYAKLNSPEEKLNERYNKLKSKNSFKSKKYYNLVKDLMNKYYQSKSDEIIEECNKNHENPGEAIKMNDKRKIRIEVMLTALLLQEKDKDLLNHLQA